MDYTEQVSDTRAGADWTDVVEFQARERLGRDDYRMMFPAVEVKKVDRPSHLCPWVVEVFAPFLGETDAFDTKGEALAYARKLFE